MTIPEVAKKNITTGIRVASLQPTTSLSWLKMHLECIAFSKSDKKAIKVDRDLYAFAIKLIRLILEACFLFRSVIDDDRYSKPR